MACFFSFSCVEVFGRPSLENYFWENSKRTRDIVQSVALCQVQSNISRRHNVFYLFTSGILVLPTFKD